MCKRSLECVWCLDYGSTVSRSQSRTKLITTILVLVFDYIINIQRCFTKMFINITLRHFLTIYKNNYKTHIHYGTSSNIYFFSSIHTFEHTTTHTYILYAIWSYNQRQSEFFLTTFTKISVLFLLCFHHMWNSPDSCFSISRLMLFNSLLVRTETTGCVFLFF